MAYWEVLSLDLTDSGVCAQCDTRGIAVTESGRAGTSAHLISVPRDVKYSVIIPDKCILSKTSSNCTSIPLLPTHTSSLPQHLCWPHYSLLQFKLFSSCPKHHGDQ